MNISVLIRLMPATRTGGRLAGQAEIVETGQTFVFAGDEEMIALLDRVATGAVEAGALSPRTRHQPRSGCEWQHVDVRYALAVVLKSVNSGMPGADSSRP